MERERWRGGEGEGVRECVLGLHLWLAVASSTRSLLSLKRLISLASSVVRSSAATRSAKHFCQSIDKIDTVIIVGRDHKLACSRYVLSRTARSGEPEASSPASIFFLASQPCRNSRDRDGGASSATGLH